MYTQCVMSWSSSMTNLLSIDMLHVHIYHISCNIYNIDITWYMVYGIWYILYYNTKVLRLFIVITENTSIGKFWILRSISAKSLGTLLSGNSKGRHRCSLFLQKAGIRKAPKGVFIMSCGSVQLVLSFLYITVFSVESLNASLTIAGRSR